MQIVTGTAKLVSHCITGYALMSIIYSTSGMEPAESSETSGSTRRPRTTNQVATGTAGVWDAGLTLRERLEILNIGLNKSYLTKESKSKMANWPVTICINSDGYVR